MSIPASIVLYGRDVSLIDSRRWVLQASGHQVEAYLEPSDLAARLSAAPVDLLILCHSLAPTEIESAIAAQKSRQPQTRILALISAEIPTNLNLPVATLSPRTGPAELVRSVDQLLGRQTTERTPPKNA